MIPEFSQLLSKVPSVAKAHAVVAKVAYLTHPMKLFTLLDNVYQHFLIYLFVPIYDSSGFFNLETSL